MWKTASFFSLVRFLWQTRLNIYLWLIETSVLDFNWLIAFWKGSGIDVPVTTFETEFQAGNKSFWCPVSGKSHQISRGLHWLLFFFQNHVTFQTDVSLPPRSTILHPRCPFWAPLHSWIYYFWTSTEFYLYLCYGTDCFKPYAANYSCPNVEI